MGRVQWNNLAPLIQSKLVLLRPRIPGCTTESSNLVEVFYYYYYYYYYYYHHYYYYYYYYYYYWAAYSKAQSRKEHPFLCSKKTLENESNYISCLSLPT